MVAWFSWRWNGRGRAAQREDTPREEEHGTFDARLDLPPQQRTVSALSLSSSSPCPTSERAKRTQSAPVL